MRESGSVEIPSAELGALRRLVISWARRGGASADEAEDIAQDVLVRVVGAWRRFRAESRLSSWTYRIARNVLASRARRATARARADARFGTDRPSVTACPEERLLGALAARTTLRRWLLDELLTEDELDLLRLKVLEGMKSAEIAARFECRPGTVRSRVCKALARVRKAEAA